MTAAERRPPTPARRRRRWLRRLLLALLLVVLLIALLLLFAPVVLGPLIASVVSGQLEQRLGGSWELAAVEELDLDGITLSGLRQIEPDARTAIRRCRIDTITVGWRPLALIGDPLGALRELRCTGLDLELDADRPLTLELDEDPPEAEVGDPLAAIDPALELELTGSAVITYGDRVGRIGQIALHGRSEDLSLSVAPWSLDGEDLDPLELRWRSDNLPTGGELQARLPVLGEVKAELARDAVDEPWRAALTGTTAQAAWAVEFAADGWRARVDGLGLARLVELAAGDEAAVPAPLSRDGRLWLEARGAGQRVQADLRLVAGEADPRPPLTLRVDGAWIDDRLQLDELRLAADGGEIELRSLVWSPARGITQLESARADGWRLPALGPLGSPELAAELRLVDDELRLNLELVGADTRLDLELAAPPTIATARWGRMPITGRWDLAYALPDPRSGRITGSGRIRGTPLAPEADLELAGNALVWSDQPPSAFTLAATLRPGRAELRRCVVDIGEHRLELEHPAVATWSDTGWELLPLQLGPHRFQAAGTLEGLTRAELAIAPTPLASLGLLVPALTELDGKLAAELQLEDGRRLTGELELTELRAPSDAEDGRWRTELAIAGDEEGLRGALTLAETGGERHLQAALEIERPFSARWDWFSDLATAPITGGAELARLPMTRLAALVPAIPYARGHIHGEASIAGTLAAPDLGGRLALHEVDLTTGVLPPITSLSGELELTPGAVSTGGLHGQLGYAPLRIAGRFALDPALEHDLTLTGERALLMETAELRVRADLDCSLSGPIAAPLLRGRIGVTEFLYTADTGWLGMGGGARGAGDPVLQLFSIQEEPWSDMRLDLQIKDGALEAETASRGLSVRTPLFSGEMLVDLTVGGTGRVPEPVGTIATADARAKLPFTTYTVESATVRFLPENPFEPVIQASLHTRMAGYEVRLQLEGPVSDPRLSVTTSPPLPSDDALLLATTGLTPAETAEGASAALGTAISFLGRELGRMLLGPGDPDAEPGLLSRVDLSIDEERSEGGLSTARVEVELTPHWFLFGERDRFEDYNGGVLYRFTLGRDREPREDASVPEEDEAIEPSPVEWELVAADGVADLGARRRDLRAAIRRQRAAFDRSGGDVLHAADAAAAITRLLEGRGHPEAQVILAFEPMREQPETIVFQIDPGAHRVWGELELFGVPSAQREAITEIARSQVEAGSDFVRGDLGNAVSQIRLRLQLDGFAGAAVSAGDPRFEPDGSVVAAIRIEPGNRHWFATPQASGVEDLPREVADDLAEILQELGGRPWMERSAIIARASIQSLLESHGYQWASVEVITPQRDAPLPEAVPVTYHIEPGPVVHLAAIELSGFEATDADYVRHRLDLEPGQALADDAIKRGLSRLRTTVPLRRLDSELRRAEDGDQAVLVIDAEEAPARHIELEAGYGSYVGPFGGLRYRDENLFGRGRQWLIGGEGSAKHLEATTSLTDRDLLGGDRRLTLLGEFSEREEPSFTNTSAVLEPSALIPLGELQALRLAYRVEWSRAEDVDGGIAGAEIDGFVRTARFDAGWSLSTFDDPWLPTSGVSLELGSGIADEAIGSELDFVELRAGVGVVLPLLGGGEDAALALRVHGKTRKPTAGRSTLPIQERLFLGGANSVRSFDTEHLSPIDEDGDAVGGLTATYAQAELRVRVIGSLHAAAFYDLGTVSPEAWELGDDLGHAVGLGARLHLPIGPLRFDVGYNPDGETFAQDDRWAMHLAVGYTF